MEENMHDIDPYFNMMIENKVKETTLRTQLTRARRLLKELLKGKMQAARFAIYLWGQ